MKRLLFLPALSMGCSLFRDPMTIPIDVTIRPHVGVELDPITEPPFSVDSTIIWGIIIAVAVAVWAFAHFGKKKN